MLTKLLSLVLPKVADVIDQAVTDKDQAAQLKAEITTQLMTHDAELTRQATTVLTAEIQGDTWLQKSWRPILMLVIVAILANNYILFPYLSLFTEKVVMLALDEQLWQLLKIGVGGYVMGRSGEKITKIYSEGFK